jgi:hypothetical protein
MHLLSRNTVVFVYLIFFWFSTVLRESPIFTQWCTVYVSFLLVRGTASLSDWKLKAFCANSAMKMSNFFFTKFYKQWSTSGMKLTGENRQLGEKPVPVPLCSPQMSHGFHLWSNPCLRSERPATNRLSHGTANKEQLLTTEQNKCYWYIMKQYNSQFVVWPTFTLQATRQKCVVIW